MTLHPGKCNIPPPKTALFGERTLGKATALRAAPAAAERVNFCGKTKCDTRLRRPQKEGKPRLKKIKRRYIALISPLVRFIFEWRGVCGSGAKSYNIPPPKTALFGERTSKMRRAHFPSERNLWSE